MARPRSRPVRRLVRTSQRSRLQQTLLDRAYELALPPVQRLLAEVAERPWSTKVCSFSVPQQRVGGV
jgi:hypothetical protein